MAARDETQGEADIQAVMHKLNNMSCQMDESFTRIHGDIDAFRYEVKSQIQVMQGLVSDLENSLNNAWLEIEELKTKLEANKITETGFQARVASLEENLKEEKEKQIQLEAYSRRENLNFKNLPEKKDENCKELIRDILTNDLQLNGETIQFHAVHRVGKPNPNRPRPIIARFLSREDRDRAWRNKNRLNTSTRFENVYITPDYPREVQKERAILVRAMIKAREAGREAKVLGRSIKIDGQSFQVCSIPEEFLCQREDNGTRS